VNVDRHMVVALGLLAGLWWLLSDGDPGSWVIGLPAVAAAVWSVRRLRPARIGSVSLSALLRFVPFFLWESLRGGLDVARRTLAPRMRVQPDLILYRTRLSRPDARVFFTNCVSLLPGTLAADLRGDRLAVHVLDAASDAERELRLLERAVARVYPQAAPCANERSA
jgi:multicomponent Na+:H+ antiporter subunit E